MKMLSLLLLLYESMPSIAKVHSCVELLKVFQHLFAHPHGDAFSPSAGDVDLEVARRQISLVGEGAYRNAAANRSATLFARC